MSTFPGTNYGAYSTPAPASRTTPDLLNWPAVVSLAVGVAAMVTFWLFALPIAAIAVVLGHVGLKHSARIGVGRLQALWGLILGYVAAMFTVVAGVVTLVNVGAALVQIAESLSQFPTFP